MLLTSAVMLLSIRSAIAVSNDNADQPINYAVHDLPGDARLLEISVLLPDQSETYSHTLYVDGYTDSDR